MTNPIYPFDLHGAGAVDRLLAFHRAVFGGWRMVDDPDDPDDPDDSGDGKPDDPDKPADFAPITSQAEFDRRLSARLSREREKFSDYADLKKRAAAHDEALEAAKSDADKAVDAARKEGESTAQAKSNSRLVSSEARALAAEAKFRNPGLAVRTVDLSDVTVDDDGQVDADAVKAKLKDLADAEPYMVDDGKPPPRRADPSQGGSGGDDKPSVSRGREMFQSRRGTSRTSA